MIDKLKNIFKTHIYLIVVVCVAALLKIFFSSFPAFETDMNSWEGWGYQLVQFGIPNFYNQTSWTDYTPGYLYFLWLISLFKDSFLSDASVVGVEFIYKLVPVFADLATGVILYLIVLKYLGIKQKNLAITVSAIYFLLPHTTMNAAIWGQADSVHTFFLMLSWYFLLSQRLVMMVIFLTFACVVKPLSGLVAPVILILLFQQTIKKQILLGLSAVATFYFTTFPFWGFNAPVEFFSQLRSSYDVYPYSSINLYNFWGAFGFWQDDRRLFWGSLTAEQVAQVLSVLVFCLVFMFGLYLLRKTKDEKGRFIWYSCMGGMSILLSITFSTRMHERYLYHFFPFLLVFLVLYHETFHTESRRILLLLGTFILASFSILHFINLYYVYTQYQFFNEGVPASNTFYYWVASSSTIFSWLHVALTFILVAFSLKALHSWPKQLFTQ